MNSISKGLNDVLNESKRKFEEKRKKENAKNME